MPLFLWHHQIPDFIIFATPTLFNLILGGFPTIHGVLPRYIREDVQDSPILDKEPLAIFQMSPQSGSKAQKR